MLPCTPPVPPPPSQVRCLEFAPPRVNCPGRYLLSTSIPHETIVVMLEVQTEKAQNKLPMVDKKFVDEISSTTAEKAKELLNKVIDPNPKENHETDSLLAKAETKVKKAKAYSFVTEYRVIEFGKQVRRHAERVGGA